MPNALLCCGAAVASAADVLLLSMGVGGSNASAFKEGGGADSQQHLDFFLALWQKQGRDWAGTSASLEHLHRRALCSCSAWDGQRT